MTPRHTGDSEPRSSQDTYVITEHNAVPRGDGTGFQEELYTIVHGTNILKVKYAESQTSTAKPGDFPGTGLHLHSSDSNPDLSQIPEPGVTIRACLMHKDSHGDPMIAKQPTPQPCMARVGGILHYELAPNGPVLFTYVNFDILSETTTSSSTGSRAQSGVQRKDIPAIAKDAQGAVVTIVMANDDKPIALGTGFFVRQDGVIVTNYHVIAKGNVAVVKFADGTTSPVDGVLATDKIRDLAIIKIHGKTFRTLALGNSDQIQIGQDVVAIGNPLGLELSVSNGIVSGVRRDEREGGKLLQITAPISHGSSGGPLFNLLGEVIGINAMFLEGGENLNFAIPINDAKRLLSNIPAQIKPGQFDFGFGVHELPNEPGSSPDTESAHSSSPDNGQSPEISSPAYHAYLELLRSGDTTFRVSTYACFDDDPTSKTFMVIDATLLDKRSMNVTTQSFTNGVSSVGGIFSGELTAFSSADSLFGSLHTMYDNAGNPSHQTDVFEWAPDVLSMKAGFGKLLPGQVRLTYEFKMQRSTGRYTERTVFAGAASDGFTVDKTGKCIRIPNTRTPEDVYPTLAAKKQLPPNTKIAASGPDPSRAKPDQLLEDIKYCYKNPGNKLQFSEGNSASCQELVAAIEARLAECTSGPKSKSDECKVILANARKELE